VHVAARERRVECTSYGDLSIDERRPAWLNVHYCETAQMQFRSQGLSAGLHICPAARHSSAVVPLGFPTFCYVSVERKLNFMQSQLLRGCQKGQPKEPQAVPKEKATRQGFAWAGVTHKSGRDFPVACSVCYCYGCCYYNSGLNLIKVVAWQQL
jgi:hypothetical protein